jgi:probable F420-dependent oxidoreductase
MQLPIQSQSTYYVEPWEAGAGAAELATIARTADEIGFDYVAVCDHVAIPPDRATAMSTTWYDTVATLGWLAGITTNVRLLSHVFVVAYRHPLVTAKSFATLDHLSGGRAILGVGAGHVEGEFDALGVPFHERGKLTDAAVDAIRAAFDEGVQQPAGNPPIWVGGSSPAAIRRAAERGNGWLPQGTPKKEMPDAIARLRALREEAGRADEPFMVGAIAPSLFVGEPTWDLGPGSLSGSADKLRHVLGSYAEMGVDVLQVRLRSRSCDELVDQLHAFHTEVMQ